MEVPNWLIFPIVIVLIDDLYRDTVYNARQLQWYLRPCETVSPDKPTSKHRPINGAAKLFEKFAM